MRCKGEKNNLRRLALQIADDDAPLWPADKRFASICIYRPRRIVGGRAFEASLVSLTVVRD